MGYSPLALYYILLVKWREGGRGRGEGIPGKSKGEKEKGKEGVSVVFL